MPPIAAMVAPHLDGDLAEIEHLSGGASRETWRFRIGDTVWILQHQRPTDERSMATEAAVLAAAYDAGVPVPAVEASGTTDDGIDYLLCTAIDGETIPRKILRDETFSEARRVLTPQLGAALAQVHSIEKPDQIDGLDTPDEIARYTEVLDQLAPDRPVLELARRWLLTTQPEPVIPRLVHGDFRLGNMIIGPEGLRAVIDWELAHLGDPMEDLGWLCVRAWRFGGRKPVAGLGDFDELFTAYEAAGGPPVEPDTVRWWMTLGTWKWAVMCIMQANAHLSGAVRNHELAAIGRRVCENEHDLLELMV